MAEYRGSPVSQFFEYRGILSLRTWWSAPLYFDPCRGKAIRRRYADEAKLTAENWQTVAHQSSVFVSQRRSPIAYHPVTSGGAIPRLLTLFPDVVVLSKWREIIRYGQGYVFATNIMDLSLLTFTRSIRSYGQYLE